jgi:hypothetical protein
MHAPTDSHWDAVKRILRYLRGTVIYGLHITHSSSFALHGFTNANWADSTDDHKSTVGYLVFSWSNTSFMEIRQEYKALAGGTAEVIWLQYLLRDLQILSNSALTI